LPKGAIFVGFYKRPELKGYFNFYKIGEAKKQGRNCLFFLWLSIFMSTIIKSIPTPFFNEGIFFFF
jgi:hypothetical protein